MGGNGGIKMSGIDIGTAIALSKGMGGSGGGGTGGGVLVVHEENNTLDKTYAEIKTASNDKVVLLNRDGETQYLSYIGYDDMSSAYIVVFFTSEAGTYFEANSEDAYPVQQ